MKTASKIKMTSKMKKTSFRRLSSAQDYTTLVVFVEEQEVNDFTVVVIYSGAWGEGGTCTACKFLGVFDTFPYELKIC